MRTPNKIYWVYGAKLKKTYIAYGNPGSLFTDINFLSGFRGFIEKFAFYIGKTFIRETVIVKDEKILDAWKMLSSSLELINSAFLLYTDYYKETIFVGSVLLSNGSYCFIKMFKDENDAQYEKNRLKQIQPFAEKYYLLPDIIKEQNNLICYQRLKKGRKAVDILEIEKTSLKLGIDLFNESTTTSSIADLVDLDTIINLSLMSKLINLEELRLYADALKRHVSVTIAHGDFVPWNIFRSHDEKALCLVDYERVGWYSPFTDYFHLCIQPRMLKGEFVDLGNVINRIVKYTKFDKDEVLYWLICYLLIQLRTDLNLYVFQNKKHKQLIKMIVEKRNLLNKTLHLIL